MADDMVTGHRPPYMLRSMFQLQCLLIYSLLLTVKSREKSTVRGTLSTVNPGNEIANVVVIYAQPTGWMTYITEQQLMALCCTNEFADDHLLVELVADCRPLPYWEQQRSATAMNETMNSIGGCQRSNCQCHFSTISGSAENNANVCRGGQTGYNTRIMYRQSDISAQQVIVPAQQQSGKILTDTLRVLASAAHVGMTTMQLDAIAEQHIRSLGGTPAFLGLEGYPATICASPNDIVAHGIPDERRLLTGDFLSLDCGVSYDGWITDATITVRIGWVGRQARWLYDTTAKALLAGTQMAYPGNTTGDIGAAIEQVARSGGCGIVYDLTGHGVGRELHEDPNVPNWGPAGSGTVLQSGMTIAIEPMLTGGGDDTFLGPDGEAVYTSDGSLGCHLEWTVTITDEGPVILTPWHIQAGVSL